MRDFIWVVSTLGPFSCQSRSVNWTLLLKGFCLSGHAFRSVWKSRSRKHASVLFLLCFFHPQNRRSRWNAVHTCKFDAENANAFKRLPNAFEFFPIPSFRQEGHIYTIACLWESYLSILTMPADIIHQFTTTIHCAHPSTFPVDLTWSTLSPRPARSPAAQLRGFHGDSRLPRRRAGEDRTLALLMCCATKMHSYRARRPERNVYICRARQKCPIRR